MAVLLKPALNRQAAFPTLLVCDPCHAQGFSPSHHSPAQSGTLSLVRGNSKRRASWSDKTISSWRCSCCASFSSRIGEERITSGIETQQGDTLASGAEEREPVIPL